ncbi:MAG: tyrosine-type recombinase/integrase, partial [Elusimicrobiota bacterium]
ISSIPGKLRDTLLNLCRGENGPVFQLPDIMLRRYFGKALKEAGIHGFRFHDLRHTFASHFIMRTNDLPTLQALLGHYVLGSVMCRVEEVVGRCRWSLPFNPLPQVVLGT